MLSSCNAGKKATSTKQIHRGTCAIAKPPLSMENRNGCRSRNGYALGIYLTRSCATSMWSSWRKSTIRTPARPLFSRTPPSRSTSGNVKEGMGSQKESCRCLASEAKGGVMTIFDGVVFIGLLLILDRKRRPGVFVGMLLVSGVFALLHLL
jgi:hypothetical protein